MGLETLAASGKLQERVGFDPVEFPHRYRSPADMEVSALLAASLAYGRADLFRPKVDALLKAMGASPSDYVQALTVARARKLLEGFVYRFNVGADMAVLLLGMGRLLRLHGRLETPFAQSLKAHGQLHPALADFTAALRDIPMEPVSKALGPVKGLQHLLPSPLGKGASKRLNLFLRWMVRGPDGVDLGIWKQVSPAQLLIPLDAHVGRISKHLGLTQRNDLSWRTAEEVTASLRLLDPLDPVRFDFALCHHGMSGACPAQLQVFHCQGCGLLSACREGPKTLRRLTLRT